MAQIWDRARRPKKSKAGHKGSGSRNSTSYITASKFQSSGEVDFEAILKEEITLPLVDHIPRIAHFVHSRIQELTWLEYAIVRSAATNAGATQVKIWIPHDTARLPGMIWKRIASLPEVEIIKIHMPDKVFGKTISHTEHSSDLARIKILWYEGGTYMDTDMASLKPSDELIYGPDTKASIMAKQHPRYSNMVTNARVMSKPGSPFLARWMDKYRDFKPEEWDRTSCTVPQEMADNGDHDLTVLPYKAGWLYPMLHSGAEVGPDPHLGTMWLGKSWWDIDANYGVHMWKFDGGRNKRPTPVDPEIVRKVPTPLFCRLRTAFDDLDGDGYKSLPWQEDKDCEPSWTKDLKPDENRKFADWTMSSDTSNVRWNDLSGHRNHGWGAHGTNITIDPITATTSRSFTEQSHAWLPVPADWDARVGTVRMSLRVDDEALRTSEGQIGLLKIRVDYGGSMEIGLKRTDLVGPADLYWKWQGSFLDGKDYKGKDDAAVTFKKPLDLSSMEPNDLSIAFDRRSTGTLAVYLNGEQIANRTVTRIASSKKGEEVWFNAKDWYNLDTGFRGDLYRLTMYADIVPAEELLRPLAAPSTSPAGFSDTASQYITHSSTPQSSYILIVFLLFILGCMYIWRAKITRSVRAVLGTSSSSPPSASLYNNTIPDHNTTWRSIPFERYRTNMMSTAGNLHHELMLLISRLRAGTLYDGRESTEKYEYDELALSPEGVGRGSLSEERGHGEDNIVGPYHDRG